MSNLAKSMIKVTLIITALFLLVGVLYYRSWQALPFVTGLALGEGSSIVKVLMLDQTVKKAVKQNTGLTANFFALQALWRLLISAGVLVLAALLSFIDLLGAALGVLSFNLATYFLRSKEKAQTSCEVNK